MSRARLLVITSLAMIAFAGNSLLCRLALKDSAIDAASFTTLRLLSGALVLWLIVQARGDLRVTAGNWLSAAALFAYAAAFSFAYLSLTAATGALLLFGAVQATMIGYGLAVGERMTALQWAGLWLALSGLIGLLLPGLSAPPIGGAVLMLAAGVAWGVYSIRGKGAGNPTAVTAGNFIRATPFAIALSGLAAMTSQTISLDAAGVAYAVASGAIASGVGYSVWYTALPALRAASAATVQLSVPMITAIGGVAFLAEPVTMRLALGSIAVLGGIALVIWNQRPAAAITASAPTPSVVRDR